MVPLSMEQRDNNRMEHFRQQHLMHQMNFFPQKNDQTSKKEKFRLMSMSSTTFLIPNFSHLYRIPMDKAVTSKQAFGSRAW